MLLYHPTMDFYHCWMRLASILVDSEMQFTEFERLRILDFLLCFPKEIARIRLPKEHGALRRQVRHLPDPYEDSDSLRQAFYPMGRVEAQVLSDMVGKGLLRRERYLQGTAEILSGAAKTKLSAAAEHWRTRNQTWYSSALHAFCSMPLHGSNGLKSRSGLMEYRYD